MQTESAGSVVDEDVARQNLIAEFEANVALWQHDDSLRQQRGSNFLTINTVLITALGLALGLHASTRYVAMLAIVFAVFGAFTSRIWYSVQLRNSEYVRFRRFQLRSIEARLHPMTTFSRTHHTLEEGRCVECAVTGEAFVPDADGPGSSTRLEGRLPVLVAWLWFAIGLTGAVVLCLTFLR